MRLIIFISFLSVCFSECWNWLPQSLNACGPNVPDLDTPWQPGNGLCFNEWCNNTEVCLYIADELRDNFWENEEYNWQCANAGPNRDTCCFFSGDGIITIPEECDPGATLTDQDNPDNPITYNPAYGNCGEDNCNDNEIPSVCGSTYGCTDNSACNYNAEAANDDGSCTYPETYYNCDGVCITDADEDGVCDELSLINGLIPEDFNLHSIYPNPFNPITNIIYGQPEHVNVQIIVYDLSGKQIETLINEFQTPGYHSVNWDADNLPSGIYFVKMVAGSYINTQKLMLVK